MSDLDKSLENNEACNISDAACNETLSECDDDMFFNIASLLDLSTIAPAFGARKRKMRICRGIGSGKGKTGGRGGKGQSARSGFSNPSEGGQTPLQRRLPKRGFNSINRVEYQPVSIFEILNAIESNALSKDKITARCLISARVCRGKRPIKILYCKASALTDEVIQRAKSELKGLSIEVHACSTKARQFIENELHGSVVLSKINSSCEVVADLSQSLAD